MSEQKQWIDAETKIGDAPTDHHDALRLWLRLFSTTRLIENNVRHRLVAEFDVTFPRFDILAQLYRVPNGLLLGELSQRLMVSPGNITAVIKRLQEDGMIDRAENPQDRRQNFVSMTARGRTSFTKMAAAHEQWIKQLMGGLTAAEIRVLLSALKNLKESIRETLD